MAWMLPAVTMTTSAPRPSFNSLSAVNTSSRASMAKSAPRWRAISSRKGTKSVAMTIPAPEILASCTWIRPVTPAPITTTVSPVWMCARSMDRMQVATGSINVAWSKRMLGGSLSTSRSTFRAGTRMYSAKPPGSMWVALKVLHSVGYPRRQ